MRTTLWKALGIASKDKAIRIALVEIIGRNAVVVVEIIDRKSGHQLYKFEPLCFEKKDQRTQQAVTIALDCEVDVNPEGVAQLLEEAQTCEKEQEEKPT
jgi:hypothetical protein